MKLIYEEMVKLKRSSKVSIRILMRFAFAFMLVMKINEKKLDVLNWVKNVLKNRKGSSWIGGIYIVYLNK